MPANEIPQAITPSQPAGLAPLIVPPQPMQASEEHNWAMLSHLSVLANLVTGFLGPIVALVIYLVYRDRSRYVAYHSLQALIFQLIWWCGSGILIGLVWAITGALSAVVVGLVLIPLACIATPLLALMPLAALVYGIVGAVQTSQGQDFKYWLIGDWVRGTLTGQPS